MDRVERIKAMLAGDPVDRIPFAFWTHLPHVDQDPVRLAVETASFFRETGMDLIKSMSNGLYCVEDWRCVPDHSSVAEGGQSEVITPAVTSPEGWDTLDRLDVTLGAYGRELDHLSRLVRLVDGEAPVLATVFSPLTTAAKAIGGPLAGHMEGSPEALHRGLGTIAQVTADFARVTVEAGCAGVLFATQQSTYDQMDQAAYETFGLAYDRIVLDSLPPAAWLNVLHMHGENVMFDMLKAYPVTALNWHFGETEPSLGHYRRSGGTRPVFGGIVRSNLTNRDLDAVRADIDRSIEENAGGPLLLSPACVIRHPVDMDVLKATAAMIQEAGRA